MIVPSHTICHKKCLKAVTHKQDGVRLCQVLHQIDMLLLYVVSAHVWRSKVKVGQLPQLLPETGFPTNLSLLIQLEWGPPQMNFFFPTGF